MQTNGITTHTVSVEASLRNKTASTKVTSSEFYEFESFAERQGQSISEWIRQTLLNEAHGERSGAMNLHIFTELVGVQMLLMDTLEPLLRGEKIAQEQIKSLFRQVQTTKAARAQEILSKRSQKQEK
jgi:Ca2+-binding EF-hand superfamily protein